MGKERKEDDLAMKRRATKTSGAPTAEGQGMAARWNHTRKQVAELCRQYYKKRESNSREASERAE